RDIMIDQNDATIATTIINLGQSLGLSVLAEGVETSEQRSFLASRGCFNYQGYFFSKPVSAATFEAYITDAPITPA
ncbi:MAG: EAL domain-containing protein, partial [Nitrosomonadales bacterium]|nr:EAL domain-containing protein [Nitrosomonadales bacterium]